MLATEGCFPGLIRREERRVARSGGDLTLWIFIYMLREMVPAVCIKIFLIKDIDEMNKRSL